MREQFVVLEGVVGSDAQGFVSKSKGDARETLA